MTTVTIAEVKEDSVKPEGAGWAKRSNEYDGPWPLYVGSTYDVEIKPWKGKRGDTLWYLNKAAPVGEIHAPPPPSTALPPATVDEQRDLPKEEMPLPPSRDETRVSIERQVCLKVAVELCIANLGVVKNEADVVVLISARDVAGDAETLYQWVSGETPYGDEPVDEAERQAEVRAYTAAREPGDGAPAPEYSGL